VRSLSTIGGENIKTNVRRLLAHIFSTDLAKTINWIGKGGKTALSKRHFDRCVKSNCDLSNNKLFFFTFNKQVYIEMNE
jgi:hypothetical protein